MKHRIATFVMPILFALSSGCTLAKLETPNGFTQLEDQERYDYRATSAQGVVIAVRNQRNKPFSGVDFWSGAIDIRLRQNGYKLNSIKLVKASNEAFGLGKQIRYTREEERRTYCYWVTLFANQDRVFVIEAGGDEEYFKPTEKRIEQAITSLKIE